MRFLTGVKTCVRFLAGVRLPGVLGVRFLSGMNDNLVLVFFLFFFYWYVNLCAISNWYIWCDISSIRVPGVRLLV